MARFPFYQQLDSMDCGPTCLRMIARYYGKTYALQTLRDACHITREGVSMLGISDAAEAIGMRATGVRISYEQLAEQAPLPCIAHWKQKHFVVVYKIKKDKVYVADPGLGLVEYSPEEFRKDWISTRKDGEDRGLCLLLEPTPDFYARKDEKIDKSGFSYLLAYFKPHKKFVGQLLLGLLFGSLIQLVFPFLTQALVDVGINNQDIGFIYLVLLAQLVLFISRISVEYLRNWILLHLSARINISLVSDFLIKLMSVPIAFFHARNTGDLLQRIIDQRRIEAFMTTSSLNVLFSLFSVFIFTLVLAWYNLIILLIFLLGSALFVGWILLFMRKRRELDQRLFEQMAENQNVLVQMIEGMQEIKLNGCEKQRRWEWEEVQARRFYTQVKSMGLTHRQHFGAFTINEIKNILITFYSAAAVIHGDMTLGMMLAVQFILGQLNAPLLQLINFFHVLQDAKISLERLGEIHLRKSEDEEQGLQLKQLPEEKTITLKGVSYQYEGPHSPYALKDIHLSIPQGKVTAIVGASGSGKTTLIKLLLGFFRPVEGEIYVADTPLRDINLRTWRSQCGVVMQDGFLFSDTIARNIALGTEEIDTNRLLYAVKMANIRSDIEELPLAYNTKIGASGIGLSQGQRQRILIARALYKNPQYLFFDEATNALDATNEKVIVENLNEVFKNKTVVIVAHRLSTVRNADQIVVLQKGVMVETGTHEELVALKGVYYHLIKNQLELGMD